MGPNYTCDCCARTCGAKPLPAHHKVIFGDDPQGHNPHGHVRHCDLCEACFDRLRRLVDVFLEGQPSLLTGRRPEET